MNLSEMRDRMRDYANVDENRLGDNPATDFLNLAKDDVMEKTHLRFGEALITTSFVASTQTINPAPTVGRVLYPTRLWYRKSNQGQTNVDPATWNEYVEKYGTAASDGQNGFGDPIRFAIYGEDTSGSPTFYLGPIPDETITPVYLAARITFEDLVEDEDENPLTVRAGLALVYRALELAATYLELPERAPEWRKTYDELISRHVVTHSGAIHSSMHNRQMQEQS